VDILAHALWAGAGMASARRRWAIAPCTVAMTVGLAALPDIPQLLPLFGWSLFGDGPVAAVRAYAIAVPGQEPALPPAVALLSHHLHCVMHSAIVAGAVTLLLWLALGSLWVPLLGWWSHIVIDVFTHSADYYASPVLYPITERGFDGLAWNTPWFLLLNYSTLSAVFLWLSHSRRGGYGP
jgi:hypothetical protein